MNNINLKGVAPESWLCVDCGINTAPGFSNRVELEKAFKAALGKPGIKQEINDRSEVYAVRDAVWKSAGMKPMGGCLCIGCAEKRLGRRLKPKDFPHNHPLNHPQLPATDRLIDRRTKRRTTYGQRRKPEMVELLV